MSNVNEKGTYVLKSTTSGFQTWLTGNKMLPPNSHQHKFTNEFIQKKHTVFAEINVHPQNKRPPKIVIFQRGEYTKPMGADGWFFKGGSTQNRWLLMGDFSKGGVHKTDGCWWVIFQRGEYTKPMSCDGWFFKGGSTQNRWVLMGDFSKGGVHKTDGFWWVIFQRGEYTKPMGCDGWFFKGGST